jgi:hypothetical protein
MTQPAQSVLALRDQIGAIILGPISFSSGWWPAPSPDFVASEACASSFGRAFSARYTRRDPGVLSLPPPSTWHNRAPLIEIITTWS